MIHFPVMCNEVISFLPLHKGAIIVDGTFGAGGYSKAILENADVAVIGIDRDPEAVKRGHELEAKFGARFRILEGSFSCMKSLLAQAGVAKVDGIVLDLGVSSPQIDQAERGFSFQTDGPLDMRMSAHGQTAADVVESLSEEELARIIWEYGEEKKSRRVARAIVSFRETAPIKRTQVLADLVRGAVGYTPGIDSATRTFMALRIYVNQELEELHAVLKASEDILTPHGRIVVVTFHSLEDRIVKNFLKADTTSLSRYSPSMEIGSKTMWKVLTKKPLSPSNEELVINPRSRSAKLRAAEYIGSGVS
ncbi:MAG: 16S rRNA (cytosine(1402)-N(4))-methyltransferase RsmH [Alphaproteobacteria bacterium]|nr:16S rRNA (cytosine(1402)-N(4))-methyltransferase RsmH [Alphaproteobacteria bacterium]OJV45497.1 MAG: 16S rRNA (cytosine(1402)-N(4))-methyltransferase [Alphaproteobacteria bacterium 43-37]